ncbi:MAG: type IV pilus assembly protein PilM [Omnitrophica bacterium]|nr:type IV pilus assembly protein PilM [Candidatus Omnitrophota bacterium]
MQEGGFNSHKLKKNNKGEQVTLIITRVTCVLIKMFGKKPKESIGLDIGNHYVKICELTQKQGKYYLSAFGIEHLDNDSQEAKVTAIKKLARESGITSNKVNISVCGPLVIVRYILLPSMTRQQLESAIKFEAEKYIPFNIEEVTLNAPILEEKREDGKIRVLIVAAKKSFIEDYVKLVESCGLEPQLIDVDSFALINSFLLNNPDKQDQGIIALLHIGANFTNINILKDGVSHFMRDITIGGRDLTKIIAEKLNMDYASAENVKCNPQTRQEEIFSIITPALNNLLGEISLSFSYYEDQLERGIDKVFLSGGTSKLKDLDKFLSSNLGMDIVSWDPVLKLQVNPALNQERLKSCLPMLSVGMGLALSSPEKT